MTDFYRFPHTPHITWLAGGCPRDDKVLSIEEASELLSSNVVLEEKLDGANVGLSVSEDGVLCVQNRGQYLTPPYRGQFARLGSWLAEHEDRLFDALGADLIAFGEWCAARHSLDYKALPDWWLLFDVYDRQSGAFWSTIRRNTWAQEYALITVRRVLAGSVTLVQLQKMVMEEGSSFRDGAMEGLVIRQEDANWLTQRAKLVRPDFTQAITGHWSKKALEWNRLTVDQAESALAPTRLVSDPCAAIANAQVGRLGELQ